MGHRIAAVLLKGVGLLIVAFLVLAAIATAVAVVLGVVATVVSVLVTLATLAVLVLAAIGLFSLLRTDPSDGNETRVLGTKREGTADDVETRIRERYVAGEIDDAEFERKLDLLHGTDREWTDGAGKRERDRLRDR